MTNREIKWPRGRIQLDWENLNKNLFGQENDGPLSIINFFQFAGWADNSW